MIIATAGHVDHGKTSLVRALTGVDTDRLPEEKQRGMSIDLGFAYVRDDAGVTLAFIDVPGHEKFIRNMMAGMSGVRLGLLVVAADDGPMPQTREHLQVMMLAGVPSLLVALTKSDLVDGERLLQAEQEVRALLAEGPYAQAPIFPLSTRSGDGLPSLAAELQLQAARDPRQADEAAFRMHIDRAFNLKGAGLVVTGTVVDGHVAPGDMVQLAPGERLARVRTVHADGSPAALASRGQRCALNLAGADLEAARLERGYQLLAPGDWTSSFALDLRLDLLAGAIPKRSQSLPVTASFGTASEAARLSLLQDDWADGLARLDFAHAQTCFCGDRILLRDAGTGHLLGAATVLDPCAPARGRQWPERLTMLGCVQPADWHASLSSLLANGHPVSLRWLVRAFLLAGPDLEPVLRQLALTLLPGKDGLHAVHPEHERQAREQLCRALTDAHTAHPDLPGLRAPQLRQALARHWQELLPALLQAMCSDAQVQQQRQYFRLPGHTPRLRAEDENLLQRMLPLFAAAGVRAPRVVELAESLGLERPHFEAALQRMALAERLIRVARNRYYLPATLHALALLCGELAARDERGQFAAADYRDLSGLGRNLTIQMLEFFDSAGLTRRQGEGRVMAGEASLFDPGHTNNGRDTLPVERAGFKPDGRCLAPLGSSTLSSSASC